MVNPQARIVDGNEKPGKELPKEYREIATHMVVGQGWRYDSGRRRGGHPKLFPKDPSKPSITIPTTPGDRRSLKNFTADVRRAGGEWQRR